MADYGAERRPYLELQLGKALNGPNDPDIWSVHLGSIYKASITAASLTYAGVIRPIVAVQTMAGTRNLTRVEQIGDIVAGSWFFDDVALVSGGSGDLYVQLSTSADPDTTTMVVQLLFGFAGQGEVHPLFGAEKYLSNSIDDWSGGNPTNWTEVGGGAVQETTIVLDGGSSAKIGSTTLAGAAFDGIQQSKVGIQNGLYRVSGYYLTPLVGQSSSAEVRLRVGTTTPLYLTNDGRNTTTSTEGFLLAPTWGEWKRFVFDFIWSGATTASLQAGIFIKNTSGGAVSGLVYADRMSFRRIHRWVHYDGRLNTTSIPEVEIRSADMLFGPKSYSIGAVSFNDGEGDYAEAFAGLLLLQKPANIFWGGRFANGMEVYKDDWRGGFPALTRYPTITDESISFELDDARTLTRAPANPNVLRVADLADMDPAAEGQTKDLVFGETEKHYLKPKRVSVNANGYGYYEYLDPTVPVADGVDIDTPTGYSAKVYPNQELADRNEKGYEINDFTNDITLSLNKTRWQVVRDIRNYRYDRAGNDIGTDSSLTFMINPAGLGGDVIYTIHPDLAGPAYNVAALVQAAGRTAIGGGDTTFTCTYSESTHKFTVSYAGADAFQLWMSGGPAGGGTAPTTTLAEAPQKMSWAILGFNTDTDKTGATTYTSDVATFTDADEDHIIRIRSGGYRDDASGTICGTANVALNTPPAVASWLLQKTLNVPVANINAASFSAGRSASLSTDFAIVFKVISEGDVLQALGEMEQAGVANLVVDGDGVWHWKRHVASSTGAREFYDRDYITWRMWQDPAMVYKNVLIGGDWNACQQRHMTYTNTPATSILDPGIPIKHGDERTLYIRGDLEREYITGGTQILSNNYGRLVSAVPRIVEFSCRGRLTDLLIGDKIKLTRARAFDTTGIFTSKAFRIVHLRHNFVTGISTCTAAEDVVFLT